MIAGGPGVAFTQAEPAGDLTAMKVDGETITSLSVEELPEQQGVVEPMSARGCTFAPGPTGSRNCVSVDGDSTWVNWIRAIYEVGIGDEFLQNMCDRGYEFQYYRKGYTTPVTRVYDIPGCVAVFPGVSTMYTLQVNAHLEPGTTACTRTRSNYTLGQWSPYACVYILQ